MTGKGASAASDRLLTIAPLERFSSGKNACVTLSDAEQVDGQVLFDGVEIAQIVIDGDAGIVDEDVERADLLDRAVDLRGVGHVQRQRRHALIGDLQRRPRVPA